ncbi:uncharacterized protein LOC111371978 [Olea europaea var. sylvestris]|uniref:uncharacterized protein LOC111371978 n=1 Tax=Olea europaea var. sylvestris TaxID=158386 RepID=UPI000C1D4D0F|nr:uncharacterized protein LOC111371978 [Olea europaea var. sylvestris]
MVNDFWMHMGFSSSAEFLPSGCLSDHSPCIVSIFTCDEVKKKPFKFFNMWTKHKKFHETVLSTWNLYIRGTKQFSLCKKLQRLKGVLKELNVKHFGHISSRAEVAKKALVESQLVLHDDPTNLHLQNEVARLRKEAINLSEAERSFYFQQAKCAYLKNSDKCTKFFHSIVKRNNKRNFIAVVLKRDGSYTSSQKQVADEFVHLYSELFGRDNEELATSLTRDVSEQEIKDALFSIGDDKSPGPDGYTSCFFKEAWDIVGNDFMEAIYEFFASRSLLKQTNHTIIALIPKTNHATSVNDYRPIACCNVFYKVITKILASRLGPTLGSIIDQAQAAFIEGRSMVENIHLVQELVRKYN